FALPQRWRSPRQLREERHPARGLGGRRVGEFEVDAPALVKVLCAHAPALARGRGQLDLGGELVKRGLYDAVVGALREVELDLRLGRSVAALGLTHALRHRDGPRALHSATTA